MTDEGFAKRTPVADSRLQNRGGLGVRAMKLSGERGGLVSALVVTEEDKVISFKASGQVIRSSVADVSPTGRDTMGVKFVGIKGDDQVVAVTVNPERPEEEDAAASASGAGDGSASDAEDGSAATSAPASKEVVEVNLGDEAAAEREATDE